MRALVVYESMFGNTRLIAEAISGGLARNLDVDTVEVGQAAELEPDLDLIVVGGPTHAFSMSRPNTRKSAADQAEDGIVSTGIGIREWLEGLTRPRGLVAAATFDTRIDKPRVPGSAAAAAHKRLRRLGFLLPMRPESFFVEGTDGPVISGEYERAHVWGEDLGAKVAGKRTAPV